MEDGFTISREDKNSPEIIESLIRLGMRARETTPPPEFDSTLEEVDPAWDPTHTLLDDENETPIDSRTYFQRFLMIVLLNYSAPAETVRPARERSGVYLPHPRLADIILIVN